jgi:hypothetical protein
MVEVVRILWQETSNKQKYKIVPEVLWKTVFLISQHAVWCDGSLPNFVFPRVVWNEKTMSNVTFECRQYGLEISFAF